MEDPNLLSFEDIRNKFQELLDLGLPVEEIDLSWKLLPQVTQLPLDVFWFENLIVFDISNNSISSLPDYISNFNNLTELWIDNNELKTLPEGIGGLNSLRTLSARFNALMTIPTSVRFCRRLTTLALEWNMLQLLPRQMEGLQELEILRLDGNETLKFLPRSLRRLPVLQTLTADGCPLEYPPADMITEGAQAVLAYLEENIDDNTYIKVTLNEQGQVIELEVVDNI